METSENQWKSSGNQWKTTGNQWKPLQTNGNQCIEESIKGNSQLISCHYVNA